MRRVAVLMISLCFVTGIFSQDAGIQSDQETASILLREYIAAKTLEANDKTDDFALVFGGSLLTVGGLGFFLWADPVTDYFAQNNPLWTNTATYITGGAITGTGLFMTALGTYNFLVPPVSYADKYKEVLKTSNIVLREALAEGILRDNADMARQERVTRGTWIILTPIVAVGLKSGLNIAQSKTWDEGIDIYWVSSLITAVTSGINILNTPSQEERLYQRYLTLRAKQEIYTLNKKSQDRTK
ncbi:hypothetical protein WKV44_00065 [Spirochaetia bacterium 38H-sp]|uniref:Uncharacterized protein n=1 Tax=Rarispira pelagica TaxID=3141764 RepID=A0ABU9U8D0_9SPIR